MACWSSTIFSPGRTPDLNEWLNEFELRYPWPVGEAQFLNPEIIAQRAGAFVVLAAESFDVRLELSRDAYIDYVLTETNVSAAVRAGTPIDSIRPWCEETIAAIWPDPGKTTREILFPSYFVCAKPKHRG